MPKSFFDESGEGLSGGVMGGPLKRGRPPESCVWAAGGHMTPGL